MKRTRLIYGLLGIAVGWCAARLLPPLPETPATVVAPAAGKSAAFQCSMHPWVQSRQPGPCTICGMEMIPAHRGGTGTNSAGSPMVLLSPESVKMLGVQTVEVKSQPLVRTLRVVGIIGENESRHEVISAPVEGRIDALSMSCEGDHLGRGQPFGNIFSRTLLATANDYKTALANGDPAKLASVRHRLEQFGLAPEQIASIPDRHPGDLYFGIRSPFTGTIVKSYVCEGQYVKEGERLFELADFTSMWFTFSVSEADLPFVKLDQIVDITTPTLPGRTVRARITFINPNLDEQTHAATVRVLLEHPELHLKNRAEAEGLVELDAEEVLAVPRRAVLWPGGTPRVFVEKNSGDYEPRAVRLGRAGDSLWEVLDGLKAGERVVLSGNLLLDSQAQLFNAAPEAGSEMKP